MPYVQSSVGWLHFMKLAFCLLLLTHFITSPCVLQSLQGSPLSSTCVFWNEDVERSCYEVPTQCSFSMCLLTLVCFLISLHPLHVKLHSPPSNINFISLLSELHLVVALPSIRHLWYFLALVPGACPGYTLVSFIYSHKGLHICWRSASAQTVKPVYGNDLFVAPLPTIIHIISCWC